MDWFSSLLMFLMFSTFIVNALGRFKLNAIDDQLAKIDPQMDRDKMKEIYLTTTDPIIKKNLHLYYLSIKINKVLLYLLLVLVVLAWADRYLFTFDK